MVVENMTMHSFSLEECRQMVYDLKANMSAGSDLQIMGPAVAEKFGLTYDQTDDINKMLPTSMPVAWRWPTPAATGKATRASLPTAGITSWWFPPTKHRPASSTRRWEPRQV